MCIYICTYPLGIYGFYGLGFRDAGLGLGLKA